MKERKGSIYDTKIRLIEADRVANPIGQNLIGKYTNDGVPKIFGGVELTDDGEVDAYWICNRHPGFSNFITPSDAAFTRIPAFGEETGRPVAMLIGESERPEQRRSVPLASKCLTELKQIQRYIESTTIQNVIKSYFCSFIKSEMPSTDMFDRMLITDEELEGLVQRDPYNIRLAPGIVNWMRPGEEISFPINSGADPQFEPFVVALCKFIGGCLGIPFEVLLQHFSASYSASRAALLAFWKRVKVLRRMIINQFCQPSYIAWMFEAISKGVWKAPGFFEDPRIFQAWVRCAWSGSSQGSIDPLKEIMASERKVRMGVSTLEMECLEHNGSDWRAVTVQQGIECKAATAASLTYIRNLDMKGQPILSLGVSESDTGDGGTTDDSKTLTLALGN
jgi:lambda family phage portal protein